MWTGVAAIWTSVAAMTIWGPDMVSGSEQEHLPLLALTSWMWGLLASRSVIRAVGRADAASARSQLSGVVAAIWTAAAAVALFGPVMVTGSDPTRLPLVALLAPVAATLLTAGAYDMVAALTQPEIRHTPYDARR